MKKALEKRADLVRILDKYRDEEHKIQGEWWPISVFCDACNKDTTERSTAGTATGASPTAASAAQGTVDLRTAKGVKLWWRVDWPMRWNHEKVDFEPAGKDHHSQGGSFDTAKHVCVDVYGWEPPITFRYDFIGIKGTPGKMSSSKGKVVDLYDILNVYTPEVARTSLRAPGRTRVLHLLRSGRHQDLRGLRQDRTHRLGPGEGQGRGRLRQGEAHLRALPGEERHARLRFLPGPLPAPVQPAADQRRDIDKTIAGLPDVKAGSWSA
jgi:hypothetical protein